jgi:hypothetical protein
MYSVHDENIRRHHVADDPFVGRMQLMAAEALGMQGMTGW